MASFLGRTFRMWPPFICAARQKQMSRGTWVSTWVFATYLLQVCCYETNPNCQHNRPTDSSSRVQFTVFVCLFVCLFVHVHIRWTRSKVKNATDEVMAGRYITTLTTMTPPTLRIRTTAPRPVTVAMPTARAMLSSRIIICQSYASVDMRLQLSFK